MRFVDLFTIIPECLRGDAATIAESRLDECLTHSLIFYIDLLFILIAIAAFFFLVVGGIKMATAFGNEAKYAEAKNTITYALIGIIVALLANTIVSFVEGLFKAASEGPPPPPQEEPVPLPTRRLDIDLDSSTDNQTYTLDVSRGPVTGMRVVLQSRSKFTAEWKGSVYRSYRRIETPWLPPIWQVTIADEVANIAGTSLDIEYPEDDERDGITLHIEAP
jgi:hypothetical protein